jgi:uncharacterized protein
MSAATISEQNKALMRQIFEGVARGDPALFYERLADDATLIVTGEYSWSQMIKGKERISRDLYGYVRSRLSQRGKTHAFNFLADGDWVVVEARGDMVTKEGKPYQNHYCMLYRLDEGRIIEIKEYQDSTLCERLLGPYPAELRSNDR